MTKVHAKIGNGKVAYDVSYEVTPDGRHFRLHHMGSLWSGTMELGGTPLSIDETEKTRRSVLERVFPLQNLFYDGDTEMPLELPVWE